MQLKSGLQADMAKEKWKQEMQAQQVQHQNDLEAQRELQRQQLEAANAEREMAFKAQSEQSQREFDRWKVELEQATKIEVATISAKVSMSNAAAQAQDAGAAEVTEELGQDDVMQAIKSLGDQVTAIHAHVTAPVKIVRGPDGKATHVDRGGIVKPISRGADGRIEGL